MGTYTVLISGDKMFASGDMHVLVHDKKVDFARTEDVIDYVLCKLLDPVFKKYDKVDVYTTTQRGCDRIITDWALSKDLDVHITEADWEADGKAAAYIRNERLCKEVWSKDNRSMILFWDGKDEHTLNFIFKGYEFAIPVRVYNYKTKRMLTQEEVLKIQLEETAKDSAMKQLANSRKKYKGG